VEEHNNKGFSLVELVVVIAIIAVLVGVIAPQFMGYTEDAKRDVDIQNAQSIAAQIEAKIAENDAIKATEGWVKTDKGDYKIDDNPEPKLKRGTFWYKVNDNGNVTISVGMYADADHYELYPNLNSSY